MLSLISHQTLKVSLLFKNTICIPEMGIIGGVGKSGFWGTCLWDVSLHCLPAFGEWPGGPQGTNTQVRAVAVLNLASLASPLGSVGKE